MLSFLQEAFLLWEELEVEKTHESNYIQQHLANERTFLAWIRTAIAIKGIGFLMTTLHFTTEMRDYVSDKIALLISVTSFMIGLIIIIFATIIYFRNRRNINTQTFTSSFVFIIIMTIMMSMPLFMFIFYYWSMLKLM